MVMSKIQKNCEVCKELFIPKAVDFVYCSKNCSDTASRQRKAQKKKDEQRKALADRIPDNRL